MIEPSFNDFEANYNAGKTQLVWSWVPSDLETPVSAYIKLCKKDPYCFLLESVEGGETLGRYSVIGYDPDVIWHCKAGEIAVQEDGVDIAQGQADPLKLLRAELKRATIDAVPRGLPPMAVSGLFGYMGYDMVRLVEDIPDSNPDDLGIPDSILIRPKILVIFDSVKKMACLVSPVYDHAYNSEYGAQKAFDDAQNVLQTAVNGLKEPVDRALLRESSQLSAPLDVQSNMSAQQYKDAVKKVVQYTLEGEIFQGVPSQRFSMPFDLSSFAYYRTLRRVNPSPFMFHLAFDGFQLVGASPEILVRVRNDEVTIRALAGTRKRGATPEEDQALADDLLADEKECAEHLMLVDLGRNDVGRVAEFGSVKVTEQFVVEYYSHVMHIVSNIVGKLKGSLDIVDALFAGFPAGTLSGAPKVRAMEIIDEVEVSRRSYYAGGVGYMSGNGTLDTCIAIRTALIKDGKLHVQAGAGVVADSDPESEHQETLNKARALIHAAELTIQDSQG
jgi:anthranilate synthase component 1